MKLYRTAAAFVVGPLLMLGIQSSANAHHLIIKGKKAEHLYNSLTGPAVQHEGAAGHLYSKGKSILCRYTDVDMTKNGKPVPPKAPCRYACSIKFNHNGLASPGPNP